MKFFGWKWLVFGIAFYTSFVSGLVLGYVSEEYIFLELAREFDFNPIDDPSDLFVRSMIYFSLFVACIGGYIGGYLQFIPEDFAFPIFSMLGYLLYIIIGIKFLVSARNFIIKRGR